MTRAEMVAALEEITAILESHASAAEKIEAIEAVVFEPEQAAEGDDTAADED